MKHWQKSRNFIRETTLHHLAPQLISPCLRKRLPQMEIPLIRLKNHLHIRQTPPNSPKATPFPVGAELNASAAPFSPSQRLSSPQSTVISRAQNEVSFQQGMKLPQINLQRFDENAMEYQAFWQAFKSAVYDNPAVSHFISFHFSFIYLYRVIYSVIKNKKLLYNVPCQKTYANVHTNQ